MSAWAPDPLNGAQLLDDVETFLARFVAFPSEAARVAVTLWAAHTHAVTAFDSSPRLALLSPEPGSGKTRTLEVLELLTPNPMHSLSASPAAIFRTLESEQTTLLMDEVDAIFGRRGGSDDGAEDLRALLNAGHRKGATIPRCVGPRHDVMKFPVFAAVALAGLGDLPDTLMSRSLIVRMRRRAPGEKIQPFRRRLHAAEGEDLRDQLAMWVAQLDRDLADAWPEMPPGVEDRPADVWESLLAIADAAGGTWPERARAACVELVKVAASGEASLGIRLLGDIRAVLADEDTDRMKTELLLDKLRKLDESPWDDLRGKELDARGLAYRLRQYDVRPHQFKVSDEKVRGYSVPGSDKDGGGLHDAFMRYLPPLTSESGTGGTSGTSQVSDPLAVPDAVTGTGTSPVAGTSREPLTRPVPAVPDVPPNQTSEPECRQCGALLLLAVPGRDVCERCRIAAVRMEGAAS